MRHLGFVLSPVRRATPAKPSSSSLFSTSFVASGYHLRCTLLTSKSLINPSRTLFKPPSTTTTTTTTTTNDPKRQTTRAVILTPQILIVAGAIVAFCLSAALGANDVANSLGTSVGTGAVNIGQALAIGAVMEFAGAVLFGATVTRTISSGVVTVGPAALASPVGYMLGMVCVLVGCTFWMAAATKFGLPVSSTHSVIGSLAGLGLVSGWGINYNVLRNIVASWFLSPLIGGVIALALHGIVKNMIVNAPRPARATRRFLPILVGSAMFILLLFVLGNGTRFNLASDRVLWVALAVALTAAGLVGGLATSIHSKEYIKRNLLGMNGGEPTRAEQQEDVERIFKGLQLVTACFLAFSHGSNDVSNAIGPFAAIYSMWRTNSVGAMVSIPPWILVLGGLGISTGLGLFGKPVMETVGKNITKLKPTMGFSVELSTALTVLVASEMGLPVSTTHTLIGCIVAIGLTNGDRKSVNGKVLANIAGSWGVTLPVSALATVLCYTFFRPFLPLIPVL